MYLKGGRISWIILGSNDNTTILGQHLIEAHWKYFTIEVKDQYECDDAAHLHYEFLIQRCQPKHYLPVLSIFRPSEDATELGTHIHPKPNIPQPGEKEKIIGEVSFFSYRNSVRMSIFHCCFGLENRVIIKISTQLSYKCRKLRKRKSKWPTQKNWDFQFFQFSMFFLENFRDWSFRLVG